MDESPQGLKRKILRSTSILGGSSLVSILLGMVRTKLVAIMLGPGGVGLMGVLVALRDILSTAAGLGIGTSGVRQIAYAAGRDDEAAISLTVRTVRFLMWGTGVLGLVLIAAGAKFWSSLSFNTTEYAPQIAILGTALLFSAISTGQTCILQGLRRIGDVARINVIGALSGTAIGVPCYTLWGRDGIVPSLILAALTTLCSSWWLARKIKFGRAPLGGAAIRAEAGKLVALGLPLMFSSLVLTGSMYAIRVYLTRYAGLESTGQYQAAFNLAGVLVNFVLAAMGTDYYPRLTASAGDRTALKKEVNAQTEIALLLAVPAICATVLFMPVIMRVFYSSKFDAAVPILRIAIFGILGRVVSWPLGYVLLAQARGALFFATELISGIAHIALVIALFHLYGLNGAGIAFAALYLIYSVMILLVVRATARVGWDGTNKRLVAVSIICVAGISITQAISLAPILKYSFGLVILAGVFIAYGRRLTLSSGFSFGGALRRIGKK